MSKAEKKYPVCPRCLGFIPNNDKPGEYPGARSRADNKTEVCSPCGLEEAMQDFARGQYRKGDGADMLLWPIESDRKVPATFREALHQAVKDE